MPGADDRPAKPVPAQLSPCEIAVEAGRTYVWCACGRSRKQPFCDGSHQGTGLTPLVYTAAKSGPAYFCGCKATRGKPMCDGSHETLARR